ncbi:MAG: hypothetical protein JXL67_07195 [Calditrichaeota bacterium]|nr:hypothetical protein [Calditrichota bacterium]
MFRTKTTSDTNAPQSSSSVPAVERVIFNIPGIQLCKNEVTGSIQAEMESKVFPADEGVFIFTRKRMTFFGEKETVEIPLHKIVTLKPLKNGIAVSVDDKRKFHYFIGMNEVHIWFICIYTIFSIKAHLRSIGN